MDWSNILNGDCFLLNMDKCTSRLQESVKRLRNAGFMKITRVRALDASTDDLRAEWKSHGNPSFDPTDENFVKHPGRQACALGHFLIWKHMITNAIPFAFVCEDDIGFHPQWDVLSRLYWEATKKDFDILYVGSHTLDVYDLRLDTNGEVVSKIFIDHTLANQPIIINKPVMCTHAYIITLQGARKLYNHCIHNPLGTRTIDECLLRSMFEMLYENTFSKFKWYVWNASMFNSTYKQHKASNGLAYQDSMHESLIGYP